MTKKGFEPVEGSQAVLRCTLRGFPRPSPFDKLRRLRMGEGWACFLSDHQQVCLRSPKRVSIILKCRPPEIWECRIFQKSSNSTNAEKADKCWKKNIICGKIKIIDMEVDMPRPSKIEVSAINLRIPADKKRNYSELIDKLYSGHLAVKVYGDSFVAITQFDKESGLGVFSKYSEIDIDGDWFDLEFFGPAAPEKVDEVSIPENLRPNLSAFYFELDEDSHILSFESYSESKSLSARSVEKFFKTALSEAAIMDEFGRVEADIVKSYGEVERIIKLPNLKELRIVIRRPNPDDVSGDLASDIERRLREQNGEEYEEIIRSKDNDGLIPNERTQKLAFVGAENGEVSGKSIVNGVQVAHTTEEKPEKIVDTYNKDEADTRTMFRRLAGQMFGEIKRRRASA